MTMFHPIVPSAPLPETMNNPFGYEMSPVCEQAAREVMAHLSASPQWKEEIEKGKMFGVLVVKNEKGETGFLAAYSGQIGGRSDWDWFVPAVFDYLQEDGYFKTHEREISSVNDRICELENDEQRLALMRQIEQMKVAGNEEAKAFKKAMKEAKVARDLRRDTADPDELIQESQYQKAEYRRLKKRLQKEISVFEKELAKADEEISCLKTMRREKSDALQQWLFSHFEMLNVYGEKRDLLAIFADFNGKIPPSGAGECCAPKLLQFAFSNHLQPICMAEFWYGASPKAEIRHHSNFYPACRGKCLPILSYMLDKNFAVEETLITRKLTWRSKILSAVKTVLLFPFPSLRHKLFPIMFQYEDDYIVIVRKPNGLLTTPSDTKKRSVYSLMRERYPYWDTPLTVHRLDMATSGLLILGKTRQTCIALQRQFENRTVEKRYVAIVEGDVPQQRGTISLPLRRNVLDRPRQIVDYENGKAALTEYEVLSRKNGRTRLALYPRTGRTHQLRVHCAHRDGLGCPILGDDLYGHKADRLYLHAEYIAFDHPVTGERMTFEWLAEF